MLLFSVYGFTCNAHNTQKVILELLIPIYIEAQAYYLEFSICRSLCLT